MVFAGDFRQILPTVKGGSRADVVDSLITSSSLWSLFKVMHLTQNMRAAEDPDYAEWLLKIGDGSANEPGSTDCCLPDDMMVPGVDDLVKFCFGENFEKAGSDDSAILCCTNKTVNEVRQNTERKR